MIIETFLICSLTMLAPYYDCDEQWIINIHDTEDIWAYCYKGWDLKQHPDKITTGCRKNYFNLNSMQNEINVGTGMNEPDHWFGHSVLYHELEHARCDCDFHDGSQRMII